MFTIYSSGEISNLTVDCVRLGILTQCLKSNCSIHEYYFKVCKDSRSSKPQTRYPIVLFTTQTQNHPPSPFRNPAWHGLWPGQKTDIVSPQLITIYLEIIQSYNRLIMGPNTYDQDPGIMWLPYATFPAKTIGGGGWEELDSFNDHMIQLTTAVANKVVKIRHDSLKNRLA